MIVLPYLYYVGIVVQLSVMFFVARMDIVGASFSQIIRSMAICVTTHLLAIVLNLGVPMGLLYGPLVLFGFIKHHRQHAAVSAVKVSLHLVPFYFFSACYLVLCFAQVLSAKALTNLLTEVYYPVYACALSLSLLVYSSIVLFWRLKIRVRQFGQEDQLLDIWLFLSFAILVPLLLFCFNLLFTSRQWGFRLDIVIDGGLFFVLMVSVYYLIRGRRLGSSKTLEYASHELEKMTETNLDPEVQRILDCLAEHELYLNPNISLELLAERVGLPKHVCSRLLNEGIGKSFYQLIAEYRIAYAVRLMEQDVDKRYSIEGLAQAAGFSSKTSFNRYFKAYRGCVPSEFHRKEATPILKPIEGKKKW